MPTGHDQAHGYAERADDLLARLRRIEGQVRGLQRMISDERYCIDVLTQVASVTRALQAVALGLLDDHVRHCIRDAVADGGDAGDKRIEEAIEAIGRLVRS